MSTVKPGGPVLILSDVSKFQQNFGFHSTLNFYFKRSRNDVIPHVRPLQPSYRSETTTKRKEMINQTKKIMMHKTHV